MTPSYLVSNLFSIKDFCVNKTTFFNLPKMFRLSIVVFSVTYCEIAIEFKVCAMLQSSLHCVDIIAYLNVYVSDVKRLTGRDVITFSVTYCEIAIEFKTHTMLQGLLYCVDNILYT